MNLREAVLEMLMEILERGEYSSHVLKKTLEKYQYLEKSERAYMSRLTGGVIERLLEMDFVLNSFSKIKVRKMKPLIRQILRMGVYELLYMDSVPDSAACNEAVKLARKHGYSALSGFVNGVLRNIARNKKNLPAYPEEVNYSIPAWILDLWKQDYGKEQALLIAEAFQKEYPLTIRANLTGTSPEDLEKKLVEEGVSVKKVPALPYAFAISGFDHLTGLESFRKGLFYVQDLSSMMAAAAAGPKMGDYCIDVCAAPGGKSTQLAELMLGTGFVEARDLTEAKTDLIRDNISRHGLANVKAVEMDATVFDPDSVEKADILICDLPCSGLGVMGRKKEIRYRIQPEDIEKLAALQEEILDTVWPYVKKGGKLIYSTCTINAAENRENTARFLRKHREFDMNKEEQFFPGNPGADGFYLAVMVRKPD